MSKIKVEFFHDVICSFCFPMSYRMRKVKELMPDLEITHRSYALVRNDSDFAYMFGSRERAKNEIVKHWKQANQNDDLHRFNIQGMLDADFLFPSSMKPLTAAKAAGFVAGDDGYWDVFDQLQNALFVENRNIEEDSVIEDCVRKTEVDFDKWKEAFVNPETLSAVESDLELVRKYGISGVPCLIIDGKYMVGGAQPLNEILRAINAAAPEEKENEVQGGVCSFDENGKINCN